MIVKMLKNKILNGNLEYYKGCLHGNYKGFYISLIREDTVNPGEFWMIINAYLEKDPENQILENYLQDWAMSKKWIRRIRVEKGNISTVLNLICLPNKMAVMINRYLNFAKAVQINIIESVRKIWKWICIGAICWEGQLPHWEQEYF